MLSEATQIKLIGASATNHQRKKNKQINRTKIIIIGLYKPQQKPPGSCCFYLKNSKFQVTADFYLYAQAEIESPALSREIPVIRNDPQTQ